MINKGEGGGRIGNQITKRRWLVWIGVWEFQYWGIILCPARVFKFIFISIREWWKFEQRYQCGQSMFWKEWFPCSGFLSENNWHQKLLHHWQSQQDNPILYIIHQPQIRMWYSHSYWGVIGYITASTKVSLGPALIQATYLHRVTRNPLQEETVAQEPS